MRNRFQYYAVSLTVVALLSGCVQSTRHSNTMIFGTNTTFGAKVGSDPAQVPSITIGYDRQEAVIMPLVANTHDDGNVQKPCDLSQAAAMASSQYLVHPCSLVATNGGAMDSYSVLASFGAEFDGSVNSGGTAGVKGGIAQYFATGMAAQLLAATGGASVVSVGEAAVKAAETKPSPGDLAKLFSTPATVARAKLIDDNMQRLRILMAGTNESDLKKKMKGFESKLGMDLTIDWDTVCTKIGPCIADVEEEKARFLPNKNLDDALSNWPNY